MDYPIVDCTHVHLVSNPLQLCKQKQQQRNKQTNKQILKINSTGFHNSACFVCVCVCYFREGRLESFGELIAAETSI